MIKEFIISKKLDNWVGMFLILLVFTIDCALGNVYKVVGSDDYVTQVYQYVSFKEVFGLIPYLLLVIISLNIRIRFDKFDISVLFTCLILQLLNCVDFFVNNNWRPMWSDWVIFGCITIPSLILKYKTYK
jgi:hypothetical protein